MCLRCYESSRVSYARFSQEGFTVGLYMERKRTQAGSTVGIYMERILKAKTISMFLKGHMMKNLLSRSLCPVRIQKKKTKKSIY